MPSDSHQPSARCPDCDRAIVHGYEHEDRCEFVGYANDEVEAVRESWAQELRYKAWAEAPGGAVLRGAPGLSENASQISAVSVQDSVDHGVHPVDWFTISHE